MSELNLPPTNTSYPTNIGTSAPMRMGEMGSIVFQLSWFGTAGPIFLLEGFVLEQGSAEGRESKEHGVTAFLVWCSTNGTTDGRMGLAVPSTRVDS